MCILNLIYRPRDITPSHDAAFKKEISKEEAIDVLVGNFTPLWFSHCLEMPPMYHDQVGCFTQYLRFLDIEYVTPGCHGENPQYPGTRTFWRKIVPQEPIYRFVGHAKIPLEGHNNYSLADFTDYFVRTKFMGPIREAYDERFGDAPGAYLDSPDRDPDEWSKRFNDPEFEMWQGMISAAETELVYRVPGSQRLEDATHIKIWCSVEIYSSYQFTKDDDRNAHRLPVRFFEDNTSPRSMAPFPTSYTFSARTPRRARMPLPRRPLLPSEMPISREEPEEPDYHIPQPSSAPVAFRVPFPVVPPQQSVEARRARGRPRKNIPEIPKFIAPKPTASAISNRSMLQSVVVPTRAFLPASPSPAPRTIDHAPNSRLQQQQGQQIADTNLAGLFAALQSNSALKAQLRVMLLSEDNNNNVEPRTPVHGNSSKSPVVVLDNDYATDEEDFDIDVFMA